MASLQIQDVFEPYYVGRKPFLASTTSEIEKISAGGRGETTERRSPQDALNREDALDRGRDWPKRSTQES